MAAKSNTNMKQYTVYFSEPVAHTYATEKFNKETKHWETVEVTEMVESATFFSLAPAKKLKPILTNTQALASQKYGLMAIGRILER